MAGITAYVYNETTGSVLYTIDNINSSQINALNKQGISFLTSPDNYGIVGTYVTKNELTGLPEGIALVNKMSDVNIDKDVIVADGNDVAIVYGIIDGTEVTIDNDFSFVSNTTVDFVEISADGYSLNQSDNQIDVSLVKYGYDNKTFSVTLIPGDL
jgi:hypothetical protein